MRLPNRKQNLPSKISMEQIIALIKEEATQYGQSIGKVGKLHLINLISRILGLFLLILTVVLCSLALFTFAAVAAIDVMSAYMPVWAAALIIGSTYLLLIIVAITCRKQLFVHPFISLMSKHLIHTQTELELATIEAEHEVEVHNMRLETKVENATLTWNFYISLIRRAWNFLAGKAKK